MTTTNGQLGLFGGLPFADVLPDPQPTWPWPSPGMGERIVPWRQTRTIAPPGRGLRAFEAWLKQEGLPYVIVDEAKKAIFAGNAIEGFDALVYCDSGPNLLVELASSPTEEGVAKMQEWQTVFGKDFVAVFVWRRTHEWVGITLADWRGNVGHARPLWMML